MKALKTRVRAQNKLCNNDENTATKNQDRTISTRKVRFFLYFLHYPYVTIFTFEFAV